MSKNVRAKVTALPARFAKPMPPNGPLSAVESLSMRTADARVRRTRLQLGTALLNLIIEKPINDVTVQDILDRSGVGRSTFYLHYRDKDDLLVS
jgi:hypothetical protein